MELRDYQVQMHDEVFDAWDAGFRNVLLRSPTGSGKSVTVAHVVKEEVGASVVLAHRGELVSQLSIALAREGIRHRVIGPPALARACAGRHLNELGRNFVDPNARCAVGSVQTIAIAKDLGAWALQVRLWVHDECHHLLRDNQFGRAVARFPNARGLGVTATPGRADGCGLGRGVQLDSGKWDNDGLMDFMVEGPQPADLIARGFLSKYRVYAPPSNLHREEIPVAAGGDFSPVKLRAATKKSTVLGDVVEHYVRLASGKLGLTFADSIENATDMAARFNAAGVRAEVLTGKTPELLRQKVLRDFAARRIQQIVSVALIDEGFDCPAVEVVSDAAATESFGRFAQRFGRGLRVLEGKTHMIYLDHVGNVMRHGLPDAPRVWTLDRRERRSKPKAGDEIPLTVCLNPLCLAPYERCYPACPYCGAKPLPSNRTAPEYVDGDLTELDPAALAALRGEVARIDGAARVPVGLDGPAAQAVKNRHVERQHAQKELRAHLALWAGRRRDEGQGDAEIMRRFYHTFGCDVMSAQALGRSDAEALTARIIERNAIDGTVSVV